jgi:alcohol dehydrogenase, propanol-preferring
VLRRRQDGTRAGVGAPPDLKRPSNFEYCTPFRDGCLSAQLYAAAPNHDTWGLAKDRGVIEIVNGVEELPASILDVIVDFVGFGTTTADSIAVVRPGGRVIQVRLGCSEATISTSQLVLKAVALRGARGGPIHDFEAVIDLVAEGDLSILTTTTSIDDIPDAIEQPRTAAWSAESLP